MKNEIIKSLKRVNETLKTNLNEAKFELMKPINLVCKFNFVVVDEAGIYSVDTTKIDNNKHYILKDNSPSNVARWNDKGVQHIIETYKVEQGIKLKAVEYKDFFKSKVQMLKKCIKSNNQMIKELQNK